MIQKGTKRGRYKKSTTKLVKERAISIRVPQHIYDKINKKEKDQTLKFWENIASKIEVEYFDKLATNVEIDCIIREYFDTVNIELSKELRILRECKIFNSISEIIDFLITEDQCNLLKLNFLKYKL
jgi:hypothetical protein